MLQRERNEMFMLLEDSSEFTHKYVNVHVCDGELMGRVAIVTPTCIDTATESQRRNSKQNQCRPRYRQYCHLNFYI